MAFATLSEPLCDDLHMAMSQNSISVTIPDGGAFWDDGVVKTRITEPASPYFRATGHELYDGSQQDLSRAWTIPELQHWVNQNTPGGTAEFDTYQTTNRRCQIEIDGDTYTGIQEIGILSEAQADVEAFAKAILEYIDAL